MESVWGDFYGVRATGNRPVPFLDAFPLTIWLHADPTLSDKSEDKIANVQVLASVTNLISVQINQYQANFLSKISKSISEVSFKESNMYYKSVSIRFKSKTMNISAHYVSDH